MRVGMENPDHGYANVSQFDRQSVDRTNNAPGRRHLGRTARSTETALHVNYDQRSSLGIQPVKQVIATATVENPINNFFANRNRVDGIRDARQQAASTDPTLSYY